MACRNCLFHLQKIVRITTMKKFTGSAVKCQPRGNQSRLREKFPQKTEYEESMDTHALAVHNVNKQLEMYGNYIESRDTGILLRSASDYVLDLSEKSVHKLLKEDSKEAQKFYRLIVASEVQDVLGFISQNHGNLNKVHFALAMKRLFREVKELDATKAELFRDHLKKDREFQVLCALLALKCPHYEAEIAADMTVFMRHLGIDTDHPTMHVYLQLLKYHLNDLHLETLVRISFSLTRMTSSKQTQVLQKAIGILCNLRSREFEVLNIWQLVTLLEIHSPVLDDETLLSLLDFIMEMEDDLTVRHSAIALGGLAKMGIQNKSCNPEVLGASKGLMNLCINQCIYRMEKLNHQEIMSVLVSCEELGVYDCELCEKAEDKLLTDDCTFHEQYDALRLFHKLGYYPKSLVNTFRISLSGHPGYVRDFHGQDLVDIFDTLSNFARPTDILDTNIKTQDWLPLLVDEIEAVWDQLGAGDQGRCLLNLTLWGQRDKAKELYDKGIAFDHDIDIKVFPTKYHQQFLLAKICNQEINLCGDLCRTDLSVEFGRALRLALKSEKLMFTPDGTFMGLPLDYLVFLDEKEQPTASLFDSGSGGVPSEGVQPVAILVLQGNSFHTNTKQLRGLCLLWARLIQDAGMHVVVIHHKEWKSMHEEDMLPCLRRRIQTSKRDQDLWLLPF